MHEHRFSVDLDAPPEEVWEVFWYLMAWCRLRGGGRTFRLDRIHGARLTDEAAPPRDLQEVAGDIAEHLRETGFEV